MAPRGSYDWIRVSFQENEWILANAGGLQKIIDHMSNPRRQYPSIVLWVRNNKTGTKANATPLSRKKTSALGSIRLKVEGSNAPKYPLLYADVDASSIYSGSVLPNNISRLSRYKIEWKDESLGLCFEEAIDFIFGRLILPFVDVICLCVDDFPTREDAVIQLQRWAKIGDKMARPWKPRVIMITKRSRTSRNRPDFYGLETVNVVASPSVGESSPTILKTTIIHQVSRVREERRVGNTLFSATHLNAFFKAALRNVAKSITNDFDFIGRTRRNNTTDDYSSHHLDNLLHMCVKWKTSDEFILNYIASALLLDSCPPGMHRFDAHHVFKALYHQQCARAFSSCLSTRDTSGAEWCQRLESRYCKMYTELDGSAPVHEKHKQNIQCMSIDWSQFKSSRTCLFCLRRKPEHVLHCGHSLCDTCACIFGERGRMEYSFRITECILCGNTSVLTVHLKPPTAGTRLLALDGGGIRGAFTLEALQALEHVRRLPYPVYEEFDLCLGTSSGGLIVLMFLLGRSVKDSITTFEALSRRVFPARLQQSFITRAVRFVTSLLTDSLYGAGEIEACMREAYGSNTLLFESANSFPHRSGSKFAVTTMAVSDSSLCLLSNYNGCAERRGYKHYRPLESENEVQICDAARATSAAPSYFPAKFVRGLGFLQDGGAGKHNNPIDPAEWESKVIWKTSSDVVVSIGTGYAKLPGTPPFVPHRLAFRDRFLARLFRLFAAILNAQGNWDEHLNRVNEDQRHKYFRINMPLEKEPELDDISKLSDFRQWSTRFLETFDFIHVVQALFSASFFFELYEYPATKRSCYQCTGSIRCRSPDTSSLVTRILQEYPAASFVTDENIDLGHLNESNLCINCGQYHKKVTFTVYHPNQNVLIYLKFSRLWKSRISGFPQSAASLAKKQMLNSEFGRPDHQTIDYKQLGQCRCNSPKKRKNAYRDRRYKRRRVV